MYYEINVSIAGQHYFATAERSIGDENKAIEVFARLREAFPEAAISMTKYTTTGEQIVALPAAR